MLSDTAVALLIGAPLYAASTVVLGVGALVWSKAIKKAHGARYAAVQADVSQEAYAAAGDIDKRLPARAPWRPPSEDDLRAAILAERNAAQIADELDGPNQPEHTTTGNEGFEETPPIPTGSLYRV